MRQGSAMPCRLCDLGNPGRIALGKAIVGMARSLGRFALSTAGSGSFSADTWSAVPGCGSPLEPSQGQWAVSSGLDHI